MVTFAFYTGLRGANISGLRGSWVGMDRRVLTIPREESKTGKPIPVYLVPEAHAVLAQRQPP